MYSAYFVIARSSGNIIRLIQRSSPPNDSPTVQNVYASIACVHRYQALQAAGQNLINLKNVS
ncbi:hypothetical protein [Aquipseudomonas ullengensis]|uniref:Uncharacterized protein n=1 Tax=Aquipseudomonas ullengensis TaxID=2759166 RepID=A0A7W4QCE8_9GAMM|nr:hypothetical protein [Pseudomonas ullengensis]MBB2497490.1 hypothetical protein [Pseudomonas ullengensis]